MDFLQAYETRSGSVETWVVLRNRDVISNESLGAFKIKWNNLIVNRILSVTAAVTGEIKFNDLI